MSRALITGITGQDGSFLAEFLLAKGYEVHGIIRRASTFNTGRLDGIYADPHEVGKLFLHYGDMTDAGCLRKTLEKVRPREVYNLAAQSHVRVSFDQPQYTADVVGTGCGSCARVCPCDAASTKAAIKAACARVTMSTPREASNGADATASARREVDLVPR